MPRPGCPYRWDYDKNKNSRRELKSHSIEVLKAIERGEHQAATFCRDTRPIHKQLFTGLTPKSCPYFAGHYRGDGRFICLIDNEVQVPSDPMVGTASAKVASEIRNLGESLASAIARLDALIVAGGNLSRPAIRAAACARLACDAFVALLTVHPYVNGNGHAARSLLFVVLRHFGYVPALWTIDPRPPFPSYGKMIYDYRRGMTVPLHQFVLSCMSPASPTP